MKGLIIDIPTVPVHATPFFESYSTTRNDLVREYRDSKLTRRLGLSLPPGNSYVRGLLFLAGVLLEEGWQVAYVNSDAAAGWREDVIREAADSDIVLISCKTANAYATEAAAGLAKTVNPEITVIAGGPHATARDVELISRGVVDIVGRGEGEQILREVVRCLSGGQSLDGVLGVTYRDSLGELQKTPDLGVVKDLSTVPFPAYDLMPGGIRSYHPYIDISRGCVYKCAFCDAGTFWQNKIRHYPIDQFFREVEYVIEHSDCNLIHIVDPLFGLTPIHREVLKELGRRKLPAYFSCDIKANYVTPQLIETMLEANVRVFCLGVESSSDEVLRFINKKATYEAELEACRILKRYDEAYVKAYWIIGLPGETRLSLHQNVEDISIALSDGLIDEVCSHIFTPYPGTDSFERRDYYGVDVRSYDWKLYDARSYPPVYNLAEVSGDEIYLTFLQVLVREIEHYRRVLGRELSWEYKPESGLAEDMDFGATKGGSLL